MKKIGRNFNESKDQAVPFALPALKSYKQSILFPDNLSNKSKGLDPPEDQVSGLTPSGKDNSKVKKENNSKSPIRNRPPLKNIKKPLKPILPIKNIQKKPQSNPRKPLLTSKIPENTKPLSEISEKPLTEYPKPENPSKNSTQSLKKPITAKIPPRSINSAPRYKSPQGNLDENHQRCALNPCDKCIKAKKGTTPNSHIKESMPLIESNRNNPRSNSLSSNFSLNKALVPRTPQVDSFSFKNPSIGVGYEKVASKDLPKDLKARSVGRRRPKKSKESDYFDFEFGPFKMSDLSIYPLL
jgi:hypothetical protein